MNEGPFVCNVIPRIPSASHYSSIWLLVGPSVIGRSFAGPCPLSGRIESWMAARATWGHDNQALSSISGKYLHWFYYYWTRRHGLGLGSFRFVPAKLFRPWDIGRLTHSMNRCVSAFCVTISEEMRVTEKEREMRSYSTLEIYFRLNQTPEWMVGWMEINKIIHIHPVVIYWEGHQTKNQSAILQ